MRKLWRWVGCLLILVILAEVVMAQYRYGRRRRGESRQRAVPQWEVNPQFQHDVFTFVRIRFYSHSSWYGQEKWSIDHPAAEHNFSYRLQQLTSLKVDPEGKVLELTDPELFKYPFIYIVEPGDLEFSDAEVIALRRYLLSGGFLMVDDFWGELEWDNFHYEIRRVFPDREAKELPIEHEIFHCVFPLKEKPQIPNVGLGTASQMPGHPRYGVTWEQDDARTPHYRAIKDDNDRIMVMICHNTDLGDGWEREGENEVYFRAFSEKWAYPLGINIIVYAMTH